MTPPELTRIRKRDGRVVDFDAGRITEAVRRAAREVGRLELDLPRWVTREVVDDLAGRFPRAAPGVEDVQDAVERALMAAGDDDVARAYVVFRNQRAELREAKRALGVRDELKVSLGAAVVLAERYLRRDERGHVSESTGEMMDRVAHHVAAAEEEHRPGASERWTEEFSRSLRALEFLPNSPTLMNAGTALGLLSACFVLPVEDSLESIFSTLTRTAVIHQAGGGTGFSFSRIRPAGDAVATTHGVASGPASFLKVYDVATGIIRQGGRRRGANMAVLDVSHPDIYEFVRAKSVPGELEHFNLSVAVDSRFLRSLEEGGAHRLVNPRTGRTAARVPAAELFDLIATEAWRTGDPGLLFLDRINRANPVPPLGRIEATNPCGEVPLLAGESCTLGSVNLARFVDGGRIAWNRFDDTVRLAVRFLDDVLDVNRYPAPDLEEAAFRTRKIGVGVMGLAELLAELGVPYGSEDALRLAARIGRRLRRVTRQTSTELAEERGAFPCFDDSVFSRRSGRPLRNAQLTSIAPTGTISFIAGTTSGIEPMFALAYVRTVLGRRLFEANTLFERTARDRGFWSDDLVAQIGKTGSVRSSPAVPEDVRRTFVTALEIAPDWHVRMQAAFQRCVDAAVSKTVNLPGTATVTDVRRLFLEAWRLGVKGITVYRDGSRPDQVLTLPRGAAEAVRVDTEYAGGCAGATCTF